MSTDSDGGREGREKEGSERVLSVVIPTYELFCWFHAFVFPGTPPVTRHFAASAPSRTRLPRGGPFCFRVLVFVYGVICQ